MRQYSPQRLVVALVLLVAAMAFTAARPRSAEAAGSPYAFAPYADLTGYPPPDFTAVRRGAGARSVTLGFVTALNATRCVPAWGGYGNLPAEGRHPYERGAIAAFRSAGGSVVPSFGGQAGSELAEVCRSVASLRQAYAAVISAYHANHVDFDIEGAAVADAAGARRRAAALAQLQRAAARRGHPLRISLTLPALPTGLDANGLRVLRATIRGGVKVSLVNAMAMDYGDAAAPHPSGRMGPTRSRSLTTSTPSCTRSSPTCGRQRCGG